MSTRPGLCGGHRATGVPTAIGQLPTVALRARQTVPIEEARRRQLRSDEALALWLDGVTMVSWSVVRCLFLLCCFGLWASSSMGASAQVRLLSEHPAERPARLDRDWPAVGTHTHNWRIPQGETAGSFPAAEKHRRP